MARFFRVGLRGSERVSKANGERARSERGGRGEANVYGVNGRRTGDRTVRTKERKGKRLTLLIIIINIQQREMIPSGNCKCRFGSVCFFSLIVGS